ncbi:hypothetical protein MyNCGM121_21020 [Achromobacter xylosoxidans]
MAGASSRLKGRSSRRRVSRAGRSGTAGMAVRVGGGTGMYIMVGLDTANRRPIVPRAYWPGAAAATEKNT